MNVLQTSLILAAAFLAVYLEAAFQLPRHLFDAQVDLLPALMIYTALNADAATVSLLAVLGGVWFDALSANPLGVSILPLFAVGFPIHLRRDLILRELPFAQMFLGAAASAAAPALTLLLLLTGAQEPLLGWGSLWQWLVMIAGGTAATPLLFALFDWCQNALGYRRQTETSFRPDREIRRDKRLR